MQAGQAELLWPLVVYFAAVLGGVVSMIVLSSILGPRHQKRATWEPYESGIASTGSARLRFSVNFYLVAMLFVIFDLEAVFTPRRRCVGSDVAGRVAYRTPGRRRWRKSELSLCILSGSRTMSPNLMAQSRRSTKDCE
jgi:hypothetical protein